MNLCFVRVFCATTKFEQIRIEFRTLRFRYFDPEFSEDLPPILTKEYEFCTTIPTLGQETTGFSQNTLTLGQNTLVYVKTPSFISFAQNKKPGSFLTCAANFPAWAFAEALQFRWVPSRTFVQRESFSFQFS